LDKKKNTNALDALKAEKKRKEDWKRKQGACSIQYIDYTLLHYSFNLDLTLSKTTRKRLSTLKTSSHPTMTQKKILENILETNMTQTQITLIVMMTEEDDVIHHQATKMAAAAGDEIKEMKIQKQREKEKKFKVEMI
jgi:hypothetical protein